MGLACTGPEGLSLLGSRLFPLRKQRLFIPRAVVAGAAYLLPATTPAAVCGQGEEGGVHTQLRTTERQTDTRQATDPGVVGARKPRESVTPNLEKGVTWGPGAES